VVSISKSVGIEFDSVEWRDYRWAQNENHIFEAHQPNFNTLFFTRCIKWSYNTGVLGMLIFEASKRAGGV